MIKVTLEFADYESAITGLARLRSDAAPKVETPAKAPTEKKETVTKTAPLAAAKEEPKADTTSYETVSAAITAAVKTHRTEVLETLGSFGAKNGKELKPEQYAEFVEKLTAKTSASDDLG